MKIDTSKNGLEKFFKPHEIIILQILWEKPGTIHTSRDIWNEVNTRLKRDTLSRATVINFLDSMSQLGLVEKEVETCRGGRRGLYKINKTEEEIKRLLLIMLYKDVVKDYSEYFGNNPEVDSKNWLGY